MAKKSKTSPVPEKQRMVRNNRVTFSLNDKEYAALQRYYSKFRIRNKSGFLREAVMYTVIQRLEEAAPTLFDCIPEQHD